MTEYDYLIGKLCEDDKGLFFITNVEPNSRNIRVDGSTCAEVRMSWIDPDKMTSVHEFAPSKEQIKSWIVIG